MESVFVLLFLLSMLLLAWGIIHPRSLPRKLTRRELNRQEASLLFGFASLAFLTLVGMTAPADTSHTAQSAQSKPSPSQTTATKSAPSSQPTVTTSQVIETQPIPFATTTQNDASLPKGQTKTVQAGQDGVSTATYEVTYTNGKETDRKLVSQVTTTQPIDEIIANGTYIAPTPSIPAPQPISSAAPTPQPAPTPIPTGCYPHTNSNNCYEPGEYCRNSDHGISGVAGNGEAIICTNNNGWRWEPE
jgi:hypothetical protein